jgi:hypothetical protein
VVEYVRKTQCAMSTGVFLIDTENDKNFNNILNLAVELIESAPGAFAVSFQDLKSGTSLDGKLKKAFEKEIMAAMERNLKRIPQKLLRLHVMWALSYKIFSFWYSGFIHNSETLKRYFFLSQMSRFKSSRDINQEEIGQWIPMRLIEQRTYNPDDSIELPPTIEKITLFKPDEIAIYELASGKLTLEKLVKRLKKDLEIDSDDKELMHNMVLPFLKRLEETYHIIFHN